MNQATDTDLLLIGKTGNGKSATGNSILKRKVFRCMPSSTSVTTKISDEVSEFNGRVIKVVDGPGVGDTRLNNQKAVELVMSAMEHAIAANPRGYHAFLLVVRFGGRFTAEDQDTITFLKQVFGHDFIRRFCILVVSCGDNFDIAQEETGQTFPEWCRAQGGVFQELLQECNNRAILFNNVTRDENKKDAQLMELLRIVDRLQNEGHRYKDENFEKARGARERVMVEAKIPLIREEMTRETSLILQKLRRVQDSLEPEDQISPLSDLLSRIENLQGTISSQDRGTGALHELVETVKSLHRNVSEELKFCKKVIEERERIKRQEAEMQRQMQEQMERQRQEYERMIQQEREAEQKRRELQEEQERRRREEEEKRGREREERERKLRDEIEQERQKQKKQTEVVERRYREVKEENDGGIVDAIVKVVSWPIRKLAEGIVKWFGL